RAVGRELTPSVRIGPCPVVVDEIVVDDEHYPEKPQQGAASHALIVSDPERTVSILEHPLKEPPLTTTPPPDTLTAALAWHAAGASVVRVATDGTKRPAGGWKQYMQERADEATIRSWFRDGHPGVGIILGAVSGNLEMLEMEGRAVTEGVAAEYGEIAEASGLGDLWTRLRAGYLETSPSGGGHLIYRVEDGPVLRNTKLAQRPATADELTAAPRDKVKALIETRGEGGFVVTAPSHGPVHETGRPWVLNTGSPTTIPTITADERDALFDIARMLDQMPAAPEPTPAPARPATDHNGGLRPGDDYEQRTTWADLLTPHGWTLIHTGGRTSYWRRPGKTTGMISATTGHAEDRDRLYVFSTSTEFATETPYTKFGAYALLHHGGDHAAAARELRRLGYGDRPARRLTAVPPQATPTIRNTPPAPPAPQQAATPGTDGTAALHVLEPPAPMRGTRWPESFTDDGNALLLADTFAADLRYVSQRGAWLNWDGHRWALDETGRTVELGRALIRALDLHALDEDLEKAARQHKSTSLSRHKIGAMLGLAQSDHRLAVSATQLDAAPRHLNTPAGIVNLADGSISPSDPAALHTRSTSVAPDPTLPTPRFNQFLADTFGGDADMVAFVQRLSGYSASADTGTHVFPFLYGPGGNGKSVLMDVLRALLADYASTAPAGFLMAGRQEHSEELARLQGLRLVVASEVNQESRFDEARLKELTGGDDITARYMHQGFFTFKPTHHLWLMGNHQPRVKSGGDGFWRRLRLIPFTYKVPDEKRVDGLADLLVAEEGPGILAWVIQGAVDHFARGLRAPQSVMAATEAYAAEEDHMGRFLEECCVRGSVTATRTETGRARAVYEQWCHSEGEPAMDARTFGRELKARGIVRKPSNGRYFYAGLGLRSEGAATQEQGW
ncbi:phage/plasmid primase, P4 family, partial [Saccharomonospora sp. NPDC046836]|uniref:phage/plasmid primase, P4 family n=1 Tax=Saccharomonospora sp. NPDC046836 TaxID=3156921 RepID=UPI0033C4DF87